MNRRDFFKKGAWGMAGVLVGGSAVSGVLGLEGCTGGSRKEKRIGLQLYSLREMMGRDPQGTLELVAKMGYKELETAGYRDGKLYGYAPAEFRKIAEDLGMKVSSAHLGQNYKPENEADIMAWWNKALDAQAEAGCRYAVQPSMHVGQSLEEIKGWCNYFNKVGEMAAAKGLKFGFHNHAGEFVKVEDKIVFDYLVENTDPKKVFFEMDVYWVQRGGYDPVEYLNKYPGRYTTLHIKDESIIGESGKLDFKAIFEAAYAQGMQDFYVEVEKYTLPPENCVERSYDFLYNADFVK